MIAQKYYDKFRASTEVDAHTGLLVWVSPIRTKGYGRMHVVHGGVEYSLLSGRLAYLIHHDLEPEDIAEWLVCHTCTDKLCVDKEHLYLGTVQDNSLDAVDEGTSAGQKITLDDADVIRELYATGNYSHSELAFMYGVYKSNIYAILHNHTLMRRSA